MDHAKGVGTRNKVHRTGDQLNLWHTGLEKRSPISWKYFPGRRIGGSMISVEQIHRGCKLHQKRGLDNLGVDNYSSIKSYTFRPLQVSLFPCLLNEVNHD